MITLKELNKLDREVKLVHVPPYGVYEYGENRVKKEWIRELIEEAHEVPTGADFHLSLKWGINKVEIETL